jgi:hypothetical protein
MKQKVYWEDVPRVEVCGRIKYYIDQKKYVVILNHGHVFDEIMNKTKPYTKNLDLEKYIAMKDKGNEKIETDQIKIEMGYSKLIRYLRKFGHGFSAKHVSIICTLSSYQPSKVADYECGKSCPSVCKTTSLFRILRSKRYLITSSYGTLLMDYPICLDELILFTRVINERVLGVIRANKIGLFLHQGDEVFLFIKDCNIYMAIDDSKSGINSGVCNVLMNRIKIITHKKIDNCCVNANTVAPIILKEKDQNKYVCELCRSITRWKKGYINRDDLSEEIILGEKYSEVLYIPKEMVTLYMKRRGYGFIQSFESEVIYNERGSKLVSKLDLKVGEKEEYGFDRCCILSYTEEMYHALRLDIGFVYDLLEKDKMILLYDKEITNRKFIRNWNMDEENRSASLIGELILGREIRSTEVMTKILYNKKKITFPTGIIYLDDNSENEKWFKVVEMLYDFKYDKCNVPKVYKGLIEMYWHLIEYFTYWNEISEVMKDPPE